MEPTSSGARAQERKIKFVTTPGFPHVRSFFKKFFFFTPIKFVIGRCRTIWAQGARAGDPLFLSSLYRTIRIPVWHFGMQVWIQTYLTRHLRTPPTQPGGSAAGAGLRRTPQPGFLATVRPCPSAGGVGDAGGIEPVSVHVCSARDVLPLTCCRKVCLLLVAGPYLYTRAP